MGTTSPHQLVFPVVVGMQSAKEQSYHFKYNQLSALVNDISWKSSLSSGSSGTPGSCEAEPFDVIIRQVEQLLLELNRVANL